MNNNNHILFDISIIVTLLDCIPGEYRIGEYNIYSIYYIEEVCANRSQECVDCISDLGVVSPKFKLGQRTEWPHFGSPETNITIAYVTTS